MENAFYQKHTIYLELNLNSLISNPEGGNRALSIRIYGRHIFSFFFFRHPKKRTFFVQKAVVLFWIRPQRPYFKPGGRKPSALYQNLWSTYVCFSRHLMGNMFFFKNHTLYLELKLNSFSSNPKGGNRALSIRICGRNIFCFCRHLMEKTKKTQKSKTNSAKNIEVPPKINKIRPEITKILFKINGILPKIVVISKNPAQNHYNPFQNHKSFPKSFKT